MRIFGILSWTAYLLLLRCGLSNVCKRPEDEINSQNCQMCPAGTHVDQHCTKYRETECKPCARETYVDDLNCLHECFPCQVCDAERGVKTYRNCSATNNTVCGPVDQHYCAEPDERGCRQAQKHTVCLPGQFIQRNGTASHDTECADCPDKTFSNTSSATHCEPHRDCQSLGLKEITAGTNSSDSECGGQSSPVSEALIVAAVLFSLFLLAGFLILRKCLQSGHTSVRTNEALPSTVDQQMNGALPTDVSLQPSGARQNITSVQITPGTEQADEATTEMVGLLQNGDWAAACHFMGGAGSVSETQMGVERTDELITQ